MIQPVFTFCGTLGLCWSCYRKSRIESIKSRNKKVIGGNYHLQTVVNLIKRQSCQLLFDCLQDNVCTAFKGYFQLQKLNTTLTQETMGVPYNFANPNQNLDGEVLPFKALERRALVYNTLPRHLRLFLTIALRILSAHNLWCHLVRLRAHAY